MRQVIYLTQDDIDKIVQKMGSYEANYNSFRAFQDGELNEVSTAFKIYKRKRTAMTNTIEDSNDKHD